MLILPPSFVAIASSFAATSDPSSTRVIASPSSALSLLDVSSAQQQEITLGSIDNLDKIFLSLSATLSRVFETISSAKTSDDFEPIFDNPLAFLSTIALVTASDMVPFVPCQPLAISLGAKYGLEAFPICVMGQTLAGVLAFQSSRKVSDAEQVQKVFESLGESGQVSFQKFKTESLLGGDKDGEKASASEKERTVFFALVGLRLAPFFPFSAGNYLLGGATDVGLRPFVLATILGCTYSNAVSVLLGMGGAELFMKSNNN